MPTETPVLDFFAAPTPANATAAGFFMIPLNGNKRPKVRWKERGWGGALQPKEYGPFAGAQGAGLALGALSGDTGAPHLVCFDGDSSAGVALLKRLEEELDLGGIWVDSSPGKQHFYLRLAGTEKVQTRCYRSIGDGTPLNPALKLDVKADGGYACLPGTLHPKGHRYTLAGGSAEPVPGDAERLLGALKFLVEDTRIHDALWRFASKATQDGRDNDRLRRRRAKAAFGKLGAGATELLRAAAEEAGWGDRFDAVTSLRARERAAHEERVEGTRRRKEAEHVARATGKRVEVVLQGLTLAELGAELEAAPPGTGNESAYQAGFKAGKSCCSKKEALQALGEALRARGGDWEHHLDSVGRGWDAAVPRAQLGRLLQQTRKLTLEQVVFGLPEKLVRRVDRSRRCATIWAHRRTVAAKTFVRDLGPINRCMTTWCLNCVGWDVECARATMGVRLRGKRVLELQGVDAASVRRKFKALRLPAPSVMHLAPDLPAYGYVEVADGGEPSPGFIRRWTDRVLDRPLRYEAALARGDAIGAAAVLMEAPPGWIRFRSAKASTITGFEVKALKEGAALLRAGKEDPEETEPCETVYVSSLTREILFVTDFIPTPADRARLSRELELILVT